MKPEEEEESVGGESLGLDGVNVKVRFAVPCPGKRQALARVVISSDGDATSLIGLHRHCTHLLQHKSMHPPHIARILALVGRSRVRTDSQGGLA